MPNDVILDGGPISAEQVAAVAAGASLSVGDRVSSRMAASRRVVEAVSIGSDAVYGINTGFGSLSRQRIGAGDLQELQLNLVRSHAAGVGAPLPTPVVRATMCCLAASLCRGYSGVRPDVPQSIAAVLNAGITPVVPETGSVGASGDLAPLAHIAMVLLGEGEAFIDGVRVGGAEALARAGLAPVSLTAKEGLALLNGTHLMAGRAALLDMGMRSLLPAAILASAMSLDACRGTDAFLSADVYAVRGHPGLGTVAAGMRSALSGSTILPSHRFDDPRVQDPYSIRCAPMVLGAAVDAWRCFSEAVGRELSAVSDNPLVFPGADREIVSAGAFHGMPIAIPLDNAAIPLAHLAGISERRTYLLLSALDPESGLTPYLTRAPGVQSGLMIAQYTAAACCNEIIGLCTPASVANIPTSAGIEDYNSFGPRSAAKASRAMELATSVVAIELMCAAEALEHQRPLRSGDGVERAHELIRSSVKPWTTDRSPAPDIERIRALITDRRFMGIVPDPFQSDMSEPDSREDAP
ncbi:MAG: histidine ammonia-lyase [Planctomycetota bacterium]